MVEVLRDTLVRVVGRIPQLQLVISVVSEPGPDGTSLLRDVAFASARGEALLIQGPTGAGKSTLLRAMAGIWPFGRGEITLGKGRIPASR